MTANEPRLGRAFFARPATEVAPDLLGATLVRLTRAGARVSGRIVETEAYREDDPASHSHRGRTARNDVMFREPGLLYVYFTYGMHFCMNVVTGEEGEGSAVLLRAARPTEGVATMRRRRGIANEHLLCSGPARLCAAFAVGRGENGLDLVESPHTFLEPAGRVPGESVEASARIGVRDDGHREWRFYLRGDPYVSKGRSVKRPSKV